MSCNFDASCTPTVGFKASHSMRGCNDAICSFGLLTDDVKLFELRPTLRTVDDERQNDSHLTRVTQLFQTADWSPGLDDPWHVVMDELGHTQQPSDPHRPSIPTANVHLL
jgi:hypothetical protein